MSETLDKLNKEFKKMNAQFKKMKYDALEELASQLTIEQRDKLSRICGSNSKIPESKIDQAIELCERTIKINKETVRVRGCEHEEVVSHKFCTECGEPMWKTTRIAPEIKLCGLCNNTGRHPQPTVEDPFKTVICECKRV